MSSSLVTDLQRLLAPGRVSNSPEDLERFAGDALAGYRAFGRAGKVEVPPLVIASPKDTEEVSALAAYASVHGIPIIPRGGGTGVMGGAVPVDGSIGVSSVSLVLALLTTTPLHNHVADTSVRSPVKMLTTG